MKQLLQRGFTLIELLVVIAIIGILAAVVLASLGDARDSAQDSAAKQTLQGLRSEAEIYYNQNSFSYSDMCTARISDTVTDVGATCYDEDDAWAVSVPLESGGFWCVDSTGAATEMTDDLAADVTECS